MRALPEKTVLLLGISLEGALILLSIAWGYFRNIPLLSLLTWTGPASLLAPLALLLALNHLLFEILAKRVSWLSELSNFKNEVVLPLAGGLSVPGIFLLAVLSGIGEELLFRGILFEEARRIGGNHVAAISTGLLFAWIHFIGAVKRYPLTFLLYCIVGISLGYLMSESGSLLLLILTHGSYNFCALLFLSREARNRTPKLH